MPRKAIGRGIFFWEITSGVPSIVASLILSLLVSGCGPRIDSSDPKQRIAAINSKVDIDQKTLNMLATTDSDPDVRCAAIRKITDQHMLSAILLVKPDHNNALYNEIQRDYVKHLIESGQAPEAAKALNEGRPVVVVGLHRMVIQLLYSSELDKIGEAAVERTTDTDLLLSVSESKDFWSRTVQEAALKRLRALKEK